MIRHMDQPDQRPIATSLAALGQHRGITALFIAGATAGKHHWELRTATGELLAVTARVHNGGRAAQTFWKLVTLTGMEAGSDIHVELRGADDRVLARISAANDAPATVTISDENGARVAHSVREKTLLLRVKHPDSIAVQGSGDDVVARVDIDDDGPWTVHDGSGAAIGELYAGAPGPSLAPHWSLWIEPRWALSVAAYNNSQQLGIRRVTQYTFNPAAGSPAPASVALTLLPLITGLTY